MTVNSEAKAWLLRGAIAVAALAAGWFALGYMLRPTAPVMAAVRGKSLKSVAGTVEVKAEFVMELKSEVGGRVKSTDLDVGKRVFAKDVLVQIDTGDVDLEIERIRNEIVAAKKRVDVGSTLRAELDNLRDTFENKERQTKAGAYPAAELEKDRRTLQQMQQRVELDEVNLRLALQNLENSLRSKEREKSKMTITAAVDGVVTAVFARAGDLIGSNSPIATIMAVGRVIEAKLSEENFSLVQVGQKASVRFLTHGNDQYNAVISKVLPSADPATQRYTVFLDVFLPEDRVLVPGLTGEVSIIIAERPDAVIVPRRALIGEYLYVLEGSRLTRRKVEKGYESLNQVEIVKGVQPGELVVVEQHDLFRDGDRVRPQVLTN